MFELQGYSFFNQITFGRIGSGGRTECAPLIFLKFFQDELSTAPIDTV